MIIVILPAAFHFDCHNRYHLYSKNISLNAKTSVYGHYRSLYCQPKVCVVVNGKQLRPLHVRVCLWQGVFCHLFFS